MTSDAKIGLLLGLVFIFVIAFVINGLPRFCRDKNNNELTTNMVGLRNNPPGLGAKERRASREVINRISPVRKVQISPVGNQNIRSTVPLPKSTSWMKQAKKTIEIKRTTEPVLHSAIVGKKIEAEKAESVKPTLPKVYVVSEGDSLAVIAKKFYGSAEGNKRINIARIFEANRKFLKLPDEIYVGQKLIIPPLSVSAVDKDKIASIFPGTMFAKVESIGARHSSADGRRAKQSGRYVVQEGDSLWRIAAEQLGDGSRYSEIAELNADILDDEDNLVVGMSLRMPVR